MAQSRGLGRSVHHHPARPGLVILGEHRPNRPTRFLVPGVQHGLMGRLEMGRSPELSRDVDLGAGAVGRPRVPYSDESGITERS